LWAYIGIYLAFARCKSARAHANKRERISSDFNAQCIRSPYSLCKLTDKIFVTSNLHKYCAKAELAKIAFGTVFERRSGEHRTQYPTLGAVYYLSGDALDNPRVGDYVMHHKLSSLHALANAGVDAPHIWLALNGVKL
jgi:hypothetical protein